MNRLSRGQSTTEFVVAMLVLAPIFIGVMYIGKFGDMKHQAIQASRFAAFEHALNPQESATVVGNEVRARFFTDNVTNKGKIRYQDDASRLSTAKTLNPLWTSLDGKPLIASYTDPNIHVGLNNESTSSVIDVAGKGLFDLDGNGKVRADVAVKVADVAGSPYNLPFKNLKVSAYTVIAGDAWNAGGADDVREHSTPLSNPSKKLLAGVRYGLLLLTWAFTDVDGGLEAGPQFGCIQPDVVPDKVAPGGSAVSYSTCPN